MDKKQSKEESQPARDQERRKVLEEYFADLREFVEKLRRKLS